MYHHLASIQKLFPDLLSRLRANDPTYTHLKITPMILNYVKRLDECLIQLRDALSSNSSVTSITLDFSGVIDIPVIKRKAGYATLQDIFLIAAPNLQEITLIHTENYLDVLANVLNHCPKLHSLSAMTGLSKASDLQNFCSALKTNTTLRKMSLINCGLQNDSIVLLAETISTHPSFIELDLTNNFQIGDVGAKALATALASNATLEVLILDRAEKITEQGAIALARALHSNTHLYRLVMTQGVTLSFKKEMIIALQTNTTFRELSVSLIPWQYPLIEIDKPVDSLNESEANSVLSCRLDRNKQQNRTTEQPAMSM